MSFSAIPDTAAIKEIVEHEVHLAGGVVLNSFEDGRRLFMRSVQPEVLEVRRGDKLQGGVAVRAGQTDIWVHPYVFRQVCTNGAITAQSIQSRHIENAEFGSEEETAAAVRAAIRECCAPKVFAAGVKEIRSAQDLQADLDIALFSFMLSHLAMLGDKDVIEIVMSRFMQGADNSRFGLMNAVTSVARDTPDPELRWRLEELGGGIPCGRVPANSGGQGMQSRAEARASASLVAIG
jgi:hypothetical protein